MKASYYHTISINGEHIGSEANIPYQYTGRSALFVQGVDIDEYKKESAWMYNGMSLMRLWIFFPNTRQQSLKEVLETAFFLMDVEGFLSLFAAGFNTTVETDPYRLLSIKMGDMEVWCRSLYNYLYEEEMRKFSAEIHAYLSAEQKEVPHRKMNKPGARIVV